MVKKVNINPLGNVMTVNGKLINAATKNIELNDMGIIYALTHGAEVTEILPDGTLIPLNRDNYNKDNTIKYEILENAYNYEQYVIELEKKRNKEKKDQETQNTDEIVIDENQDPESIEMNKSTTDNLETIEVAPKKSSRKKK